MKWTHKRITPMSITHYWKQTQTKTPILPVWKVLHHKTTRAYCVTFPIGWHQRGRTLWKIHRTESVILCLISDVQWHHNSQESTQTDQTFLQLLPEMLLTSTETTSLVCNLQIFPPCNIWDSPRGSEGGVLSEWNWATIKEQFENEMSLIVCSPTWWNLYS